VQVDAQQGKGGVVVALTRRRSKKVDEALSKLGYGGPFSAWPSQSARR
jgi:hypothetical protein